MLTVATTTPTITIGGGAAARANANANAPTISVTSDAVGYLVTATLPGETVTAGVQPDHSWTAHGTVPLPIGDNTINARVSGAALSNTATQVLTAVVFVATNTTTAQTIREGLKESIWVTGVQFAPGETVQVWLHSTPVLLGTFVADRNGNVSGMVVDAANAPLGLHHVMLVSASNPTPLASQPITVVIEQLSTLAFPGAAVAAAQSARCHRSGSNGSFRSAGDPSVRR